jgi:hypothetical protein
MRRKVLTSVLVFRHGQKRVGSSCAHGKKEPAALAAIPARITADHNLIFRNSLPLKRIRPTSRINLLFLSSG